jgi:hypothetical protein
MGVNGGALAVAPVGTLASERAPGSTTALAMTSTVLSTSRTDMCGDEMGEKREAARCWSLAGNIHVMLAHSSNAWTLRMSSLVSSTPRLAQWLLAVASQLRASRCFPWRDASRAHQVCFSHEIIDLSSKNEVLLCTVQ